MDSTIIHSEIPSADVEKLRRLHEGLFGWKIEKYPGVIEYWIIHTVSVDNEGNAT
jgi:predicted enzyme related to lactoylglutathione lyase